MVPTLDSGALPDKRREPRRSVDARISTTSIDPIKDPVTGATFYESNEGSQIVNLSRRGVCLRCLRAPPVASRLLLELHLPGERRPIELVGRTCWGRVEHEPGEFGARAVATVGIEVLGGSKSNLDRFDYAIASLEP